MLSRRAVTRCSAAALTVAVGSLGLVLATPALAEEPAAVTSQNVIMIIGDGMGYNHIDAASLWEHGESIYQSAEDNPFLAADGGPAVASQEYQEFPVQLGHETGYVFSPEYSTINAWESPRHATRHSPQGQVNVTDSGAAATALSSGVRTRGGYLGWDRDEDPVKDMVDHASERGMATGVVTDARFWADTPAGFAVHADDGEEESIIRQLMYHDELDVVMGGGHPAYTNTGEAKTPYYGNVPQAEWEALSGGAPVEGLPDWTLVDDRQEFIDLATAEETPQKVFGIAQTDGALFHDRPGDTQVPFAEPQAENIARLDELALATYNILDNSSEAGFFTMVEAATIDSASHNDEIGRAIEGVVALNRTVEATTQWVEDNSSWEETTVIVTADHETGNLWGAGTDESGQFQPLTGEQGEVPAAEFTDFTDVDPEDPEQAPHYHTHQLVPLFARGPLAEDLAAATVGTDPVRGDYLRNIDIAHTIHESMQRMPALVSITGARDGEEIAEGTSKSVQVHVHEQGTESITAQLRDEDDEVVHEFGEVSLADGRAELDFVVPDMAGDELVLTVAAGAREQRVRFEVVAAYQAPQPPFTDVPFGIEHYEAMAWMKDTGISTGWADGTYRPLQPVHRDAMAAFLHRLAGEPEVDLPEASPFTDVDPGDEHYEAIVWAAQSGITTGWSDGTFRPTEPIGRDAMAAFVYRYAGEPEFDAPAISPFTDVPTTDLFYTEVAWMHERGLATGWADGSYRPLQPTKRDATAAFLFRLSHEQNIVWVELGQS
ncbi:MAG TPA: alkaline phosphatase [Candidatus Brachybacterium merdigallinarum]|nr:alkaline phosphatase [Candidatus Brachybacterium merdigallinarum]